MSDSLKTYWQADFNFKTQKLLLIVVCSLAAVLCTINIVDYITRNEQSYEKRNKDKEIELKWIAVSFGTTNFLVCLISAISLLVKDAREFTQAAFMVLQFIAFMTIINFSSKSQAEESEAR